MTGREEELQHYCPGRVQEHVPQTGMEKCLLLGLCETEGTGNHIYTPSTGTSSLEKCGSAGSTCLNRSPAAPVTPARLGGKAQHPSLLTRAGTRLPIPARLPQLGWTGRDRERARGLLPARPRGVPPAPRDAGTRPAERGVHHSVDSGLEFVT